MVLVFTAYHSGERQKCCFCVTPEERAADHLKRRSRVARENQNYHDNMHIISASSCGMQ